jgi:hypothetical protein
MRLEDLERYIKDCTNEDGTLDTSALGVKVNSNLTHTIKVKEDAIRSEYQDYNENVKMVETLQAQLSAKDEEINTLNGSIEKIKTEYELGIKFMEFPEEDRDIAMASYQVLMGKDGADEKSVLETLKSKFIKVENPLPDTNIEPDGQPKPNPVPNPTPKNQEPPKEPSLAEQLMAKAKESQNFTVS